PRGVMRRCPLTSDRAASHRAKGSGLEYRAHIHMQDEAAQHSERGDVVQDPTDGDENPAKDLRKPHNDAGQQEKYAAPYRHPEVQLLTSIEEADIIRRTLLCIGGVLLYLLHPFCVRIRPGHYRTPVLDFDEQKKQEGQTEPRVEKACHRTAPKERSNP